MFISKKKYAFDAIIIIIIIINLVNKFKLEHSNKFKLSV